MNTKKAVIFDFDGTLVDSMPLWVEINEEFFSEYSIDFKNENFNFNNMTQTEVAHHLVERFALSKTPIEVQQVWLDMSIRKYSKKNYLKAYVRKYIATLHQKGIKMAIATANSEQIVRAVLRIYELDSYISMIASCCEVKKAKPSPEVYLAAAKKIGVNPKDCLAFEDTLEGVRSAKAAKMTAYAIHEPYYNRDEEEIRTLSDGYIYSFEELC